MKTLFICPTQPIANGIGTQKRAWSHLEALARMGTVDLVLPLNPGQIDRLESLDPIRSICRHVHVVALEQTERARRSGIPGLSLARRWLTFGKPMLSLPTTEGLENLREEISRERYALVFCFRLRSFSYLSMLLASNLATRPKIFVDFDDVESVALQRELTASKRSIGFEQAQIMKLEVIETMRRETSALGQSDGVSVCSDIDAQRLISKKPEARIYVVPNSLPRQRLLALQEQGELTHLLFLGTMNYHPNEDGAIYFCRDIMPAIQSRTHREFVLDIVGRRPSAMVRALATSTCIRVVGGVESVEPYYAQSDIVIAPIRFGGGTRIKILEALSFGRPVVSTTIGAEGLDLVSGRDILIADTPEEFAAACVRLAESKAFRTELAQAGRARFEELYESRSVQDRLIRDLRSLIEKQD